MARVSTGVVGVLSFFSGIAVASYAFSKKQSLQQPKAPISANPPTTPVSVQQSTPVPTPKILKPNQEVAQHPTAKYGLPIGGFVFKQCANFTR